MICETGVAFADTLAVWTSAGGRFVCFRRCRSVKWFACLACSGGCCAGCVEISLSVAHDSERGLDETVSVGVAVVLARFVRKGACCAGWFGELPSERMAWIGENSGESVYACFFDERVEAANWGSKNLNALLDSHRAEQAGHALISAYYAQPDSELCQVSGQYQRWRQQHRRSRRLLNSQ